MIITPRRIVLGGLLVAAACLGTGCNMGADIPVVQFPEGQKPAPPVPAPVLTGKAKAHMSSVSKGSPGDYSR